MSTKAIGLVLCPLLNLLAARLFAVEDAALPSAAGKMTVESSVPIIASPVRYARAGDLQGDVSLGLDDQEIALSPDGNTVALRTSQGVGIWNVDTWQGINGAIEGERWPLWSHDYYVFTPDSKGVLAVATLEGKLWIASRNLADGATVRLAPIPKDLDGGGNRVIGFDAEGKGIFILVRQQLQRNRFQPTDDHPSTEDRNSTLLVSAQYRQDNHWERIAKRYPEAYAEDSRDYVLRLDLTTHELRRVFTGNDISRLVLSPDKQTFLALQGKHLDILQNGEGNTGRGTPINDLWSDLYLIPIPKVEDMPLVDLTESKEKERNAGWFDCEAKPVSPALRDIGVNEWATKDPLAWSPDGTQVAYIEMGTNHTGDVWVYDLRSRQKHNITEKLRVASLPPRAPEFYADRLSNSRSRKFGEVSAPRWSADGKSLLFCTRGYLWRVGADGQTMENLSPDTGAPGIVDVLSSRLAPNLAYTTAAGEIWVRTTEVGSLLDGIARLDPQTHRLTTVVAGGGFMPATMVDAANARIFYLEVAADDTPQLRVAPLSSSGASRPLTAFMASARSLKIPEKQLLRFTTKSGRQGWAILHFPPGARLEAKWPLIVSPIGPPPNSTWQWSALEKWRYSGIQALDSQVDVFTRAGYALLYTDVPLSNAGADEEIRPAILEAFASAVAAAKNTGRIAADKIGLFAESNRDMSPELPFYVLVALTGGHYGAAVAAGGFGSLTSQALAENQFGHYDPSGMWRQEIVRRNARMPGYYVSEPERYERNSALPYFGQVKTPLLVVRDLAMKPAWDESFAALLPTGTPTVAALTRASVFPRALAWFNEHLRGGPKIAGLATLPEIPARDLILLPDRSTGPDEPSMPELPVGR